MNFYKYINDEKLSNVLRNIKVVLENDKDINNNDDDIEWIKKEIYGYNLKDSYPEYRILSQKLCFDIQTPAYIQNGLNRDWEYLLEDMKDELDESYKGYENTLERLKNNKIYINIFELETLLYGYVEGPVFSLSNEWLMVLNKRLQKEVPFDILLTRIYTDLKISDFQIISEKIKEKAIFIYKNRIENTNLHNFAEEIFMSNGNNTQINHGSFVINGNNNDVKENTINYTVNETKENDFIEELKDIIKNDKEQPDMVKNLAINELENIKATKSEEERIAKWNKFRSMVADWTTILTPLTPFLIGLGI